MAIDGSITLPALTLSADSLSSPALVGEIELLAITLSGSLEGPKALPEFTLEASAATGWVAEADVFVPNVQVAGIVLPGNTGQGDADLPALTLEATTGNRGSLSLGIFWVSLTAVGVAGAVSKGSRKTVAGNTIFETQPTLPGFTLAGAARSQLLSEGDVSISFDLAADGLAGNTGDGDAVLFAPRVIATSITGRAAAGAVDLPGFTLAAGTSDGSVATGTIALPEPTLASLQQPAQPQPLTAEGDATLGLLTLTAVALAGSLSTASITLNEPTLSAISGNSASGDGDVVLAEFTLAATSQGAFAADAVIRLPESTLSAQGVTGNVGVAELELPLLSASGADGVLNVTGTATILLPMFQLGGGLTGAQAIQSLVDAALTGIALNVRTKAVSLYEGLAPNSIARFGDVTLMATADGIVALSGDTDRGADIEASFTTGKSDLGTATMKRVLSAYVGYSASGDMELTLIADDHHEFVYALSPRRIEGEVHSTRAKFGRGVSGMYWQFKAANVDGADFAFDRIEPMVASTGVRV